MKKSNPLTNELLVARMNEAGWSVQDNGRVLCPVYGAGLSLSADRQRAYLNLHSSVRLMLDTRGSGHVQSPPEVSVDGVRLVSFEAADLRNPEVLQDAAALIRDLEEQGGVLVRQGGYPNTVGVRTGGVTALLEKARPRAARTVRFVQDPRAVSSRPRIPGLLPMMLTLCAPVY